MSNTEDQVDEILRDFSGGNLPEYHEGMNLGNFMHDRAKQAILSLIREARLEELQNITKDDRFAHSNTCLECLGTSVIWDRISELSKGGSDD